ncbi:MAG: RNA polymerase sigma factor region1.1 domain-containing protein [Parvularculaceae bacterium]
MVKKAAATKETETAEPSDGPILDLTDADVKKLIKTAKSRGYVTYDELNKVLPSEEVSPNRSKTFSPSFPRWASMSSSMTKRTRTTAPARAIPATTRKKTPALARGRGQGRKENRRPHDHRARRPHRRSRPHVSARNGHGRAFCRARAIAIAKRIEAGLR